MTHSTMDNLYDNTKPNVSPNLSKYVGPENQKNVKDIWNNDISLVLTEP